jgi:hypothetical protein
MNVRTRGLPFAGLASLALLWVPLGVCAQTQPLSQDPYAIYNHARDVWQLQIAPRLVWYEVAVRYRIGERTTTETHRALWRQRDGRAFVKAISQEEDRAGYVPHGIDIGIPFAPTSSEFFEPFGVPELSPFFSFGIRNGIGSAQKEQDDAAIKVIGRVSVAARNYTISLVGIEPCNGVDAYHLHLEPVRKADEFPLRDFWIRTRDATPCKLDVNPNFSESPAERDAWEVSFAQLVPFGTVITEEHPLHQITFDDRKLDDVHISFSALEPAKADAVTDVWQLDISGTDDGVTREPDER